MAATKAAIKAQAKWDKEHTKMISMKLNIETDRDILDRLDQAENRQDYIKRALRQYNAIEQAIKAGTPISIDCNGICIGSMQKEGV